MRNNSGQTRPPQQREQETRDKQQLGRPTNEPNTPPTSHAHQLGLDPEPLPSTVRPTGYHPACLGNVERGRWTRRGDACIARRQRYRERREISVVRCNVDDQLMAYMFALSAFPCPISLTEGTRALTRAVDRITSQRSHYFRGRSTTPTPQA